MTTTSTAVRIGFDQAAVGDTIEWDVIDRSSAYLETRTVRGEVTAVTANTVRVGTKRLTRARWDAAQVRAQAVAFTACPECNDPRCMADDCEGAPEEVYVALRVMRSRGRQTLPLDLVVGDVIRVDGLNYRVQETPCAGASGTAYVDGYNQDNQFETLHLGSAVPVAKIGHLA